VARKVTATILAPIWKADLAFTRVVAPEKEENGMQAAVNGPPLSLSDAIARCMTTESMRRSLAVDPVGLLESQGYDRSWFSGAEELSALNTLRAPLLDFSDEKLGKAVRRSRRGQADSTAIELLLNFRGGVVAKAREVLAALKPPPPLEAIFSRALADAGSLSEVVPCLPALDFPAAVYASCTGRLEPALPASVASLFYYIGISLYDDIVDKDLDESWQGTPEAEIGFASLTLFSGLPGLALEHLAQDGANQRFIERAARFFQRAAYEVNVGQCLDIGTSLETGTNAEDCERIVRLKTGSTGALCSRLGAELAGLDDERREQWAEIGCALYSAMQIASDIHDVWGKPVSPDLGNGILTLPIVYACNALEGERRERLRSLLGSRSERLEDHQEMRALVSASGALRYSLLRAEVFRQRAICGLAKLKLEPPGSLLMAYVIEAAQMGDLSA
jgi:geranylgeranyl pyrophosphate synthase